jgi:hypothetical protein
MASISQKSFGRGLGEPKKLSTKDAHEMQNSAVNTEIRQDEQSFPMMIAFVDCSA